MQVTKEGIRVALKVPLPASWNAGTPSLLLEHFFLTKIKRRGVEMRIIVGGKDDAPGKPDPTLLRAMARAQRWFEEIAAGRVKSSAEIARREGLQKGYLARLTRLAFIAPRIVEAGAEGRAPAGLILQMLMTKRLVLPLAWKEQERLLDLE